MKELHQIKITITTTLFSVDDNKEIVITSLKLNKFSLEMEEACYAKANASHGNLERIYPRLLTLLKSDYTHVRMGVGHRAREE